MSLPQLWCHSDVQLHKELLKNDGKAVGSNNHIFRAKVVDMHKVSPHPLSMEQFQAVSQNDITDEKLGSWNFSYKQTSFMWDADTKGALYNVLQWKFDRF